VISYITKQRQNRNFLSSNGLLDTIGRNNSIFTYRDTDPDRRAAVLKGFGLARGITLEAGQVVNGAGNFSKAPVEWQRTYHPKPLNK